MDQQLPRASSSRTPLPVELDSPTATSAAQNGTSVPYGALPQAPGGIGPDVSTSGPSDPSVPSPGHHRRKHKGESISRRKPSSHSSPGGAPAFRQPSYGKRRAAAENAFEHNPMFEEGMDIFQDPLSSGLILDAKVLELQRRARELGPAPLPPPKSPRTPQSQTFSPTILHSPSSPTTLGGSPVTPSPQVRQSLDANVASIRGQNRSPNMSPTLQASPLGLRPISPLPGLGRAPSPLGLQRVHSLSSSSPTASPVMRGKNSLGHLLSDIKRISKGKEKEEEDALQELAREHQAENRIAAIRSSSLAQDPQLLQRVGLTTQQLSRRYEPIYRALAAGEPPPNPLEVLRWRDRVEKKPSLLQPLHHTTTRSPSLDVPKTIAEEPTEQEGRLWGGAGDKQKHWQLNASLVETFTKARHEARKYGSVLSESPASQELALPRAGVERRASDGTTAGKSSASGGSGRNLSGPSSFRFPFSSAAKASTDRISSSSSQQSREGHDSLQPLSPLPPASRKVSPVGGLAFPTSIEEQAEHSTPRPLPGTPSKPRPLYEPPVMEKGISMDSARTPVDMVAKSTKTRRRLRNSLPGIIDSSKTSLAQLLSPRSVSTSLRPGSPPIRSHTSPRLGGKGLGVGLGQLAVHQQSDNEEASGRSSFSDNPLSPNQSASEDGGAGGKRLKQPAPRKQSRLSELVESEKERDANDALPGLSKKYSGPQELSTSDDDISARRGLAIARAGKRVVAGLNPFTKRDDPSFSRRPYDERTAAFQEGNSRPPTLFRLQTDATERPGTTSDRMLRSGKRARPTSQRPPETEEKRLARKIEMERNRAVLASQRLSLVEESRNESRLISEALKGAVTSITDYITNQSYLADSNALGISLNPVLTSEIFEVLHPPPEITSKGYKSIEENFEKRRTYLNALDAQLEALGVPHWPESIAGTPLQTMLDRVPQLHTLIGQMTQEMRRLQEEMDQASKEQNAVRVELAKAEAFLGLTAEKIDNPFPELVRNDELARQLGPDNIVQVLPEWVPSWAQAVLFRLSPIVRWLAESILLAFKHKHLFNFIPERLRTSLLQFLLTCIIASWNITVEIFSFASTAYNHPTIQRAVSTLSPLVSIARGHPGYSVFVFTSLFWVLFLHHHPSDPASPPVPLVVHPNS